MPEKPTLAREAAPSIVAALVIGIVTGGASLYVNAQVFGARLTRVEKDVTDQKAAQDSLRDVVERVQIDVSWIRGKLESKP